MGALETNLSQLATARTVLKRRWDETKAVWNDGVRRDFEQESWSPLEDQVDATLQELEHLAQLIGQARRSVH